jgi:hypothetical protein
MITRMQPLTKRSTGDYATALASPNARRDLIIEALNSVLLGRHVHVDDLHPRPLRAVSSCVNR